LTFCYERMNIYSVCGWIDMKCQLYKFRALNLLVWISDMQNIKLLQLIWWMRFSAPASYGVQNEKFRRVVTEIGPRRSFFFCW
jgi:hypothetical protein